MLTPAAVKAAQPQGRAYKLFDEGGLFLFVAPSGLKSWRFKYRSGGREKLLVLGRFPALSLAAARAARDAARVRIERGEAPSSGPEKMNTFAAIARGWHADQLSRWSPAHAADVLASLERDVFPALGETPVGAISAPELLAVVRAVEARGCVASARRLRQRLSAVYGYACALGLAESDPAEHLGRAMRGAALVRPHAALTAIDDCRALLAACDGAAASAPVRLAMRFLALTAVRLDAVRGARWEEFEGLDGPAPVWRVPPARMKLARLKKAEASFAHLVPLCPQAVRVLEAARQLVVHPGLTRGAPPVANLQSSDADLHDCVAAWPENGLVFARAGANRPFGENALRDLIVGVGYSGRHVPHGWRASFSTILNDAMGPDWAKDIDRALAHAAMGKVEAAYNRAAQIERRRELYERWGAMLCGEALAGEALANQG